MARWRPGLIVLLILADLAILFGTPFLETVGDVPRTLGATFSHFGQDPAASALSLVRLLLGAALLAAILDQIRIWLHRPTVLPLPPPDTPGWTDLQVRQRSEQAQPAAMAVRDRWHDLPAWTWEGSEGTRNVQVGDTVWQVDRFTITIETGIDFDEALRRIEVHDAFRQLADDAHDFERRRAVVMALTAGMHWPFLGRSTVDLATTRITAAVMSALDGVFVLRSHGARAGTGPAGDVSYLVAPTTAATRLVENDPDLVVALVDHLDPPASDHPGGDRSGDDLQQRLLAAATRAAPRPALGSRNGQPLAPPSQEAVFRIQPVEDFQRDRANTSDQRSIVSVARIERIYLSTQTPTGIPIGTFQQVTAQVTAQAMPLERPTLGPGPASHP